MAITKMQGHKKKDAKLIAKFGKWRVFLMPRNWYAEQTKWDKYAVALSDYSFTETFSNKKDAMHAAEKYHQIELENK